MPWQLSGQAAGLRLPSLRLAKPKLPQNSSVCHPVQGSFFLIDGCSVSSPHSISP